MPGQSVTAKLTVKPSAKGSMTVQAALGALEFDPITWDNSRIQTIPVKP
jgi:hypothetical protein